LTLRIVPRFLALRLFVDDPHSFATAAGSRLYDHGVLDFFGKLHALLDRREQAVRSRNDRHAGLLHGVFCRRLVAHGIDHRRRGADELDAVLMTNGGELSALGEKTIAWMDGIGVG